MIKTQEELNQLKGEYESLNKKLHELTAEELNLVTGGEKSEVNFLNIICPNCSNIQTALSCDVMFNKGLLITCKSCNKTYELGKWTVRY